MHCRLTSTTSRFLVPPSKIYSLKTPLVSWCFRSMRSMYCLRTAFNWRTLSEWSTPTMNEQLNFTRWAWQMHCRLTSTTSRFLVPPSKIYSLKTPLVSWCFRSMRSMYCLRTAFNWRTLSEWSTPGKRKKKEKFWSWKKEGSNWVLVVVWKYEIKQGETKVRSDDEVERGGWNDLAKESVNLKST